MLSSIGKNVWDGEFHEFRFDWYADRVEFYVDGEIIQVNRHFVPDVRADGTLAFGSHLNRIMTVPGGHSPIPHGQVQWLPGNTRRCSLRG